MLIKKEPIVAFNNILVKISNDLEKIIFGKSTNKSLLAINDKILFVNKSILVLGIFELNYSKTTKELKIKITSKSLNRSEFEVINNITLHWDEINKLYLHYLLMYNNIAENYEDIPQVLIDNLVNKLLKNQITEDEYFFIPMQNKIKYLFDKNKYLGGMYEKISLIIKFQFSKNQKVITYKIYEVTNNKLCQSKNGLNNLRFDEINMVKTGTFKLEKTNLFITKLFNYGEILE